MVIENLIVILNIVTFFFMAWPC